MHLVKEGATAVPKKGKAPGMLAASKAHKGDEGQIENMFYKIIYRMKEADSEELFIEHVKAQFALYLGEFD